jgi:hypothetical protein
MGLSPIKRVEYSDGLSNLNGVFGRCAVVGCRITAKRFRIVLSRGTPNSKGTGYDVNKRVGVVLLERKVNIKSAKFHIRIASRMKRVILGVHEP